MVKIPELVLLHRRHMFNCVVDAEGIPRRRHSRQVRLAGIEVGSRLPLTHSRFEVPIIGRIASNFLDDE